MKVSRQKQIHTHKAILYMLVFASRCTKVAVLSLLLSFMTQPIIPVFASEVTDENAATVHETSEETSAETNEDNAGGATEDAISDHAEDEEIETNEITDQPGVDADTSTPEHTTVDEMEIETEVSTQQQNATSSEIESNDAATTTHSEIEMPVVTSTTSATTEDISDTDTITQNNIASSTSVHVDDATMGSSTSEHSTSTPPISSYPVENEEATSTQSETSEHTTATGTKEVQDEISTEVPDDAAASEKPEQTSVSESSTHATDTPEQITENIVSVTNDENRYQFGVDECVSVGDESFYCSKGISTTAPINNGVYADFDGEGDKEIYVRKNNAIIQITDNSYEDAAPFYDESAEQIVFHRLIHSRYQIFQYDIETGVEHQLSSSPSNSMEPTQADGVTVWQEWVHDNWEIALAIDGEIKIITQNDKHDVAPAIKNGYIMWHTTSAEGEHLLSVYEIRTGITSTIADPEGGEVANPRFVLVYDTTFENGDMVTKEYDPETGEIRPVGSTPAPAVPKDIPEPDTTGETRALVNSKSTSREHIEEFDDGESGDDVATTTPNNTATSTEHTFGTDGLNMTLDLSESTSTPLLLDDFDLIVDPIHASSGTSTSSAKEEAATSTFSIAQ